jgi:Spy/CpxP family protein refolding chaperone
MKKILVMLSLVCLTTFAFAQGQRQQRPEPPSAKEMITKATKELSLTDQQVTQWEEIHEKYESSMGDRSKAKATREKMSKELEATLSEEQLVKFKKMKQSQGQPPRKN